MSEPVRPRLRACEQRDGSFDIYEIETVGCVEVERIVGNVHALSNGRFAGRPVRREHELPGAEITFGAAIVFAIDLATAVVLMLMDQPIDVR